MKERELFDLSEIQSTRSDRWTCSNEEHEAKQLVDPPSLWIPKDELLSPGSWPVFEKRAKIKPPAKPKED